MSSSTNDIPRANPELDRLLTPIVTDFTVGKYVDSDPERTPVYPAVHELPRNELLLSERKVKAYRESFRGEPMEGFNLRASLKPLIADIFDAMMDMRYALDNEKSKAFTELGMSEKWGHTHPVDLVVAVACKLLQLLVNGTRHGFMESNDEDQVKEAAGHEIPDFAARKLELCNALKLEKSIAHDVLSGDEQIWVNFVFAPGAYAVVKAKLRCSMERKARRKPRTVEREVYMPDTDAGADISRFFKPEREPRYECSRYPFFDEYRFPMASLSMIGTDAYFNKALPRLPPQPDQHLNKMKEAKPYFVIKMYEAIRDVTDIQNAPNSADYKRFVVPENGRQPAFTPRTSPKAIMEACWRMLEFFLDGVEKGFLLPYSKPDPAKEPVIVSHSDYHCVRRFASMLEILRREKTVCWKFLKSSHGLDEFVYWPYEYTDYRREVHSINEWLRAYEDDRDQMLADAIDDQEENDALHTIAADSGLVSADAAAFIEELRARFSAAEDANTPDDSDAPEEDNASLDDNASEDDDNDFEGPAALPSDDWDMDADAETPINPALEAMISQPVDQMDWAAVGVEDADLMEIDSLHSATASRSMAPAATADPAVAYAQHEELEDIEFLESCTMLVENTDEDGQVTIN